MEEKEKQKLEDTLIPFSLGKRNCVGMNLARLQLKMVLAAMLRSFRFELQSGEVTTDFFLTLKPVGAHFKVYAI
jgi:cytochrome P450